MAKLPTAPQSLKNAVAVDTAFWVDNGESLELRFKRLGQQIDLGRTGAK